MRISCGERLFVRPSWRHLINLRPVDKSHHKAQVRFAQPDFDGRCCIAENAWQSAHLGSEQGFRCSPASGTNVQARHAMLRAKCCERGMNERIVLIKRRSNPKLPKRQALVAEDKKHHCFVHLRLLHGAVHGGTCVTIVIHERLQEVDGLHPSCPALVQAGLARANIPSYVSVEEGAHSVASLQRLHRAGAKARALGLPSAAPQPPAQPHNEHLWGFNAFWARRCPESCAWPGQCRWPRGVFRVLIAVESAGEPLLWPHGYVHAGVHLRARGQRNGTRAVTVLAFEPARAPERRCSCHKRQESGWPPTDNLQLLHNAAAQQKAARLPHWCRGPQPNRSPGRPCGH
mmetsp:Transcript_5839/g.13817  ORF Transcript_5839/g.13817 Transcript_5839/m.13817 type:complete len:345 (-) Transcript_5839:23-1057(-)